MDLILRSGRLNSSRLPEDYDITQLAKDLDFYQLPPWQKLIERVDARVLGFMSYSWLDVAIDNMLKQIYEGDAEGLQENPSCFLVHSSESGELTADIVRPSDDIGAKYASLSEEHFGGFRLFEGIWPRMQSLLRKRGFEAELQEIDDVIFASISW